MPTKAGSKTKTKSKTAVAARRPATSKGRVLNVAGPGASVVLEFRDGRRTAVWKSCSTDASRPVLVHPWLIRTGQPSKRRLFLCATDSYQAVKVPVVALDGDGNQYDDVDESLLGPIPVAAVKLWTKQQKKTALLKPSQLKLTAGDAEVELFGPDASRQSWPRPEGNPPDLGKMISEYVGGGGLLEEFVVAFNPAILALAAAALGATDNRPIIMRFVASGDKAGPTGLRPMVLTVDNGGGVTYGKVRDLDSTAILMPVRVVH